MLPHTLRRERQKPKRRPTPRTAAALIAASSLLLAACGSDAEEATGQTEQTTPATVETTTEIEETEEEQPEEITEPSNGVQLSDWPQPYQDFIESAGGSKFVEVNDDRMHYIETGPEDGQVVLLLHGIPTQTYLWRNVIPELEDKRVFALDLIGYGRSDRPDSIEYTPEDHVNYIDGFVEELGLEDVNLVTHDLGGIAGLGWASQNPEKVASVTMLETLWTPVPSLDSLPGPFAEFLTGARNPELGEKIVGEDRAFLNLLPQSVANGLDEADLEVYNFGWDNPKETAAVMLNSGPLAFPTLDENPEAAAFVQRTTDYLTETEIPKLVVAANPGLLSNVQVPDNDGELVTQTAFAEQTFPNTTVVTLDGSGHYIQEDQPKALGTSLAEFLDQESPTPDTTTE